MVTEQPCDFAEEDPVVAASALQIGLALAWLEAPGRLEELGN
jgi:hypothetical protein